MTTVAPPTATAAELAQVFGVNPATLRKWVQRGRVAKHGRDAYDLRDVAGCVAATR